MPRLDGERNKDEIFSRVSGEVSYRIGEKGAVKVLFSSDERAADERTDREVRTTFKHDYSLDQQTYKSDLELHHAIYLVSILLLRF